MKPIEALMRYEENPYDDEAFDVVHEALKDFERLKKAVEGLFSHVREKYEIPEGQPFACEHFRNMAAAICKESEGNDEP